MPGINCYCGSGQPFSDCCQPHLLDVRKAPTAIALMRSRYSAYVVQDADYLWETTAPKERHNHTKADILEWAKSNQWLKLEIINSIETTVEFKAYYIDYNLQAQIHHEKSFFMKEGGKWYYVNGEYRI